MSKNEEEKRELFSDTLNYIEHNQKTNDGNECFVTLRNDEDELLSFNELHRLYVDMCENKKSEIEKVISVGRGLGLGDRSVVFMIGWIFKAILSSIEKKGNKFNIRVDKDAITEKELKIRNAEMLEEFAQLIRDGVVNSGGIETIGKVQKYD